MKKDHFRQKLLLWPQVPFKGFNLCRPSVPSPSYFLILPPQLLFYNSKFVKLFSGDTQVSKYRFHGYGGMDEIE